MRNRKVAITAVGDVTYEASTDTITVLAESGAEARYDLVLAAGLLGPLVLSLLNAAQGRATLRGTAGEVALPLLSATALYLSDGTAAMRLQFARGLQVTAGLSHQSLAHVRLALAEAETLLAPLPPPSARH